MFGLGFWEIMVLVIIVLLFFEAKEIPKVTRTVGKALYQMRKASRELRDAIEFELDDPAPKRPVVRVHEDHPPAGYGEPDPYDPRGDVRARADEPDLDEGHAGGSGGADGGSGAGDERTG